MDGRDVFSELADLAAEARAMRDDCDRVADVLWAVAVLLWEAGRFPIAASTDAAHRSPSSVPATPGP